MEKIEFDSVESLNLFVNEGHYLPVSTNFRIGKNPILFTVIDKVGSCCITIAPKINKNNEQKNKKEKVKALPKNRLPHLAEVK